MDTLESLTTDIEMMCGMLGELLQLQDQAIDNVKAKLDLFKERLAVCKGQASEQRLLKFRAFILASRKSYMIQSLSDQEREIHMQAIRPFKRSLDQRFSAYEGVGASLQLG